MYISQDTHKPCSTAVGLTIVKQQHSCGKVINANCVLPAFFFIIYLPIVQICRVVLGKSGSHNNTNSSRALITSIIIHHINYINITINKDYAIFTPPNWKV